eukprot:156410-Chlamydomonas_euryale.AAC.5
MQTRRRQAWRGRRRPTPPRRSLEAWEAALEPCNARSGQQLGRWKRHGGQEVGSRKKKHGVLWGKRGVHGK